MSETENEALDLDLELVGHLVQEDSMSFIQTEGLAPEMLFDDLCRAIFIYSRKYKESNGSAPEKRVLEEEFNVEIELSTLPVGYIVSSIRERFQRSRATKLLKEAARLVPENPTEALTFLQETAAELLVESTSTANTLHIKDTEPRKRSYRDRCEGKGVRGVSFGFPEIDDFTLGLLPEEVAVLVASPKTGKSYAALQVAISQLQHGTTPYLASLENTTKAMGQRLDCLVSGVGSDPFTRGELSFKEVKQLNRGYELLQALPGDPVIDQPPVGLRTVGSLFQRAISFGCSSLIIDQLSWIESTLKSDEQRLKVVSIMGELHSYAQKYRMPVLLVAQFNRDVMYYNKDKMGSLHNIALSSAIEQTVDFAFALHQTPEMKNNKTLDFGLIGSRRTDTAAWELHWELKHRCDFHVRQQLDLSELQ